MWLLKWAWMCRGEKQSGPQCNTAVGVHHTVFIHYNIHVIHDAVNRENMQVYAIWLLYF